MEGAAGVTVTEVRVVAATVKTVDPVTVPEPAVIVAAPALTAVANPCEPD